MWSAGDDDMPLAGASVTVAPYFIVPVPFPFESEAGRTQFYAFAFCGPVTYHGTGGNLRLPC